MKRLLNNVSALEQVLHGIANGITVQDPAGDLVFVNRAAAAMMNCASPEEAVRKGGRAIAEEFKFYNEQGQRIGVEDLPGRQALQGLEEPEMILGYTLATKRQPMRWMSLKAMPVFDDQGQVMLAVNVLQDITKLKEAERRLIAANDRITKLLEQTLKVE